MKKTLLLTAIFILTVTNLCNPSFSLHQRDAISILIRDEQSGNGTFIKAKGVGLPPTGKRASQAHLLARRAAIVDAYRNLLRAFDDIQEFVWASERYIVERGFIKGVHILDEVTYPDGKVEVEVGLVVDLKGGAGLRKVKKAGYRVLYGVSETERPYRVITREEWVELNVKE